MPNALAYFAIFCWPVIALLLFRRLPLPAGIAAAIMGGFLLLPTKTAIDLPLLPAFNKDLSAVLAALLLAAAAARPANVLPARPAAPVAEIRPGWLPTSAWARLCLLGLVGGTGLTAILNSEPLIYGPLVLRGIRPYDAFSALLTQFMAILPFLLARRYLATAEAQRMLLVVLMVAMALYTLPALFEVRFSPQLNAKIYGFFPHSWKQHVRAGGFRPLVFLSHGLVLSLLLSMGLLAALACARLKLTARPARAMALAGLLALTLFMSKSLGALMIATVLTPFMLLARPRVQAAAAMVVALIVVFYPVLRANNFVPVEAVANFAENIDPVRAGSLRYRLENEDILLEKASQKPVLGWGGWGRSRVYDATGRDLSTTDGYWVIILGLGGWTRYLSTFGLLCIPIVALYRSGRRTPVPAVSSALALILAANLIDLIPNAGVVPVTWLLAGSLAGALERKPAAAAQTTPPEAGTDPPADPAGPSSVAPAARSPYAPIPKRDFSPYFRRRTS